jgi:hypothetical protein
MVKSNNPLTQYRRILREVRQLFEPFTKVYCKDCLTPCCVRPTRVTPVDVSIAAACGASFEGRGRRDPFTIAVEYASQSITDESGGQEPAAAGDRPCEFLEGNRCVFPDDLRPFGCTTYICNTMYEEMDSALLRKLTRAVKELKEAREQLMRRL